ncbi:MAG TPA: Ig-like domain-containing protein [Candidatus Binataceae bacterium]|nr:Ig-like domain-containing protein [Candidatus Binataceae bacterium]
MATRRKACQLRRIVSHASPFAARIGRWLIFLLILGSVSLANANVAGIYTQLGNNQRVGWNQDETQLTVSNVAAGFSSLFTQTLDGVSYGQPLYVADVNIAGTVHNVIYVATELNSVYAFDADTSQPALWHVNLTPSGETQETSADTGSNKIPVIGITATPVIDPATNTIYVVTTSKTTTSPVVFYHRLHALDITSGAERANSPVEITGLYPGTGGVQDGNGNEVFTPESQFSRTALLLVNGEVYVAFGGYEDQHCYQGWIMSYDKTTLVQNNVISTSPNLACGQDTGAGFWTSGLGLAADSTSIYASTSNSLYDGAGDYGDTTLKLGFDLSLTDYFTPCNQAFLDSNDVDLGSGGVLLIPGTSLAALAGKEGTIYLLNTGDMGQYTPPPAGFTDTTTACTDNVVQKLWRVLGQAPTTTDNRDAAYGIAGYYQDGASNTYLYWAGSSDHLKAYTLQNSAMSFDGVNQTATQFPSGGTIPVVSSNGTAAGSAILWAIQRPNPPGNALLEAYDATDLTHQIVTDLQVTNWTTPSFPFLIPTIANGKVYTGGGVPGAGQLTVFGLSSPTPTPTATPTTTPLPTATPGIVTIVSPTNGATVSGTISIVVSEPSPPPGSWVNIHVDGNYLASSPPLTFSWNTTSVGNGQHTIDAQVKNSSGQLFITSITVTVNNNGASPTPTATTTATGTPTSTPTATPTSTMTATATPTATATASVTVTATPTVTVSVTPTTAPTATPVPTATPAIVTITAPANGATVSGSISIVVSEPSPPPGSWVNIHIDGNYLASSPPLTFTWDTTSVANGQHTIDAQVKNSSGQLYITSITVTVDNQGATPTATATQAATPTPTATTMATATPTLAPTATPTGTEAITATPTSTATPAIVTITSPANGATVVGTISIVVSEPSPPAGSWVNIHIDGNYLASSPPLTFSWNTTSVPDGQHTIDAQVKNSSGQLYITSITVTVAN